MTARNVYNKVYATSEIPVARLNYNFMKDGVIQFLGGSICVCFNDDHEENIRMMEECEKTEGFMHWINSDEGERFVHENLAAISNGFINMIMNQI